jgi:hypothetical protein
VIVRIARVRKLVSKAHRTSKLPQPHRHKRRRLKCQSQWRLLQSHSPVIVRRRALRTRVNRLVHLVSD